MTTSILLTIAGFLTGVVVMMMADRKKIERMKDLCTGLEKELAAVRREAELLNTRLNDERNAHERQLGEANENALRQLAAAKQEAEQQMANAKREAAERLAETNRRNEQERTERTQLMEKQFDDRLHLLQEQLKTTTEQLLKQRSEELDRTNRTQMDAILAPMKAVMNEMKKSMDDNKESFTRSTASLSEQLKQMHATTTSLGEEAEKLSKALQTGPKVQGDFGEMKLNDLLDKFGFTKGVEYDVQYTMRDVKGNVIHNTDTNEMMRPDVVLHYPDHKDVIIDAKASLTAFVNYVNADNDADRKAFLDEHVKSVRKHIDELAAKDYGKYSMEGGTTLDFVIMFMPQEAAMQLAISADATLWSYAFDRKVMITGEQNLFALLRLLQMAWTQQRQTDNQEKVFGLANTLVDRVGLFIERFDKVGKSMESLQKAYDDAGKSLMGNQSFLTSARKLVAMGAKENKRRPLPVTNEADDSETNLLAMTDDTDKE